MSVLIIRYGEISLKSHSVRRRFTDILIRNIQDALLNHGIEGYIEEERGRLYLYTEDRRSVDVVRKVFGVVSVSWAEETDSDMDNIADLAVRLFQCRKGSFAVRATRTGNHPYTSQELAAYVGEKILERCGDLEVNLKKPDFEVHIEVRNSRAFVFFEKIKGVGGMPLGTQGTIAGYLRDEMDLLAMWMMMKRGCKVIFSLESREDIGKIAKNWGAIPVDENIQDIIERKDVLGISTGHMEDCMQNRPGKPIFCPLSGLSDEKIMELRTTVYDVA